ncbi:MAG: hypothetical protein LDL10_00925 [Calditerrivibrio sp.]|nr:hypothetical protein [Calditerrivibrio sp.]
MKVGELKTWHVEKIIWMENFILSEKKIKYPHPLKCVLVDEKNIVASDNNILLKVQHNTKIKKDFLFNREAIKFLKENKRAKEFKLYIREIDYSDRIYKIIADKNKIEYQYFIMSYPNYESTYPDSSKYTKKISIPLAQIKREIKERKIKELLNEKLEYIIIYFSSDGRIVYQPLICDEGNEVVSNYYCDITNCILDKPLDNLIVHLENDNNYMFGLYANYMTKANITELYYCDSKMPLYFK